MVELRMNNRTRTLVGMGDPKTGQVIIGAKDIKYTLYVPVGKCYMYDHGDKHATIVRNTDHSFQVITNAA